MIVVVGKDVVVVERVFLNQSMKDDGLVLASLPFL